MPEVVGSVNVEVKANLDRFQSGIQNAERRAIKFDRSLQKAVGSAQQVDRASSRAGQSVQRFGRRLETTARSADRASNNMRGLRRAAGALGLAAVFAQTTKNFLAFDKSLTQIITLVGINTAQVQKWRDELLQLGPAVAKGPNELADALFFITSAGLRGEQAMSALAAAAKGSAIGLGETKTVADAATSAMNAYGAENLSAEKAVAILTAAVREGKAEAASIAPVLGSILPVASELNVSFDQVAASIAAMTRLGASAAESAVSLQSILVTLARGGTQQAAEALAEVSKRTQGVEVTFLDLKRSVEQDGLFNTLLKLKEIIGEDEQAMANIFPEVRALRGLLNLLGSNVDQARQVFDNLASSVDNVDREFAQFAASSEGKYQLAVSEIAADFALLAETTLPTLARWLRTATNILVEFKTGLTDMNDRSLRELTGRLEAVRKTAEMNAPGTMLGDLARADIRRLESEIFRRGEQRSMVGLENVVRPARIEEDPLKTLPPRTITDEQQKQIDRINDVANALQFQREQLTRTERAQAQFDALQAAGIDITHRRAGEIMDAAGALYDLETATRQAQEAQENFNATMQQLAQTGADMFLQLVDGTLTWQSALQQLIPIVVEMITQMIALQSAQASLGSVGGSIAGGGGGFLGALLPAILHEGGGYQDAKFNRVVPASTFKNAPRLHSGLMADEFPAILQQGEQVLPRGGGRRNPAKVVVLVEASPFFDARVQEVSGPVAAEVSTRVVGEVEKRRQRGQMTGAGF